MPSWHVITSSSLPFAKRIHWLFILRYVWIHETDQLTVHPGHVITYSSLQSTTKINWLCILGMRLTLHRYSLRERLIDCAFLACDYLFVVTFREKEFIDSAFSACDYLFIVAFRKKFNCLCILGKWLPLHWHVPRERLIDCAFLAKDYLFIVTFPNKFNWLCILGIWLHRHRYVPQKKINWLGVLGMGLPLHRYVPQERLIDCAFLACDYFFIVTFP